MTETRPIVLAAGGTCIMVCVNLVGLPGLEYIRRRSQLPIHGHRAMFGSISRSEQLGIGFRAWQKIARLSGADHLHTNGISNKFYETDAQVLVWQDMAGLTHGKTAKFVKRFADVGSELRSAAEQYADEVRRGAFPAPEHSY